MSRLSPTSFSALDPFAFAKALWHPRRLLWQFTQRNVELRHKGSHLGLVWSLLNPLLTLATYVFVFGYIFSGRFSTSPGESRLDYALGLFLGLIIYQCIAEVLATAPVVIISNPNFVKKVVFPLEILPAAGVGASLFHMLISLSLVLIGILAVGPGLNLRALWLPLIFMPLIPLTLGIAWLFSAIGVFFRDIGQMVGLLSMALMFSSAVVYPASSLPPPAWAILRFNPVLVAIEMARNAAMLDQPIRLAHLSYLWGVSFLICILGFWVFRKLSPGFADVI